MTCPHCGAEHEPLLPAEPCLAACVRALSRRVEKLEPSTVTLNPETTTISVPLGGTSSGSGKAGT